MDDIKTTQEQELKSFNWKSISAPEIYSNYFHIGWTLDDVRITLGSLKAEKVNTKDYFAEEKGTIVLPWRQAKNLHDSLTRILAAYEDRNGVIKTLFLAEVEENKKAPEPSHEG